MLCPNCGSQNGFIAKFCQCYGKDLRATSMASASRRSYAGFGRRFAAYLQDNALVYMGMGLSIFVLDLIFAPTAVG